MQEIDRRLEELRRLEPTDDYLAEATKHGADVVAVGPFRAIFSPGSDNLWLNHAAPVDQLGTDGEVVGSLVELRRLFTDRQRVPRLELNEPVWPRLPALAEAAGFVLQEREPLMLCTPADFRSFSNPQVSVRFLRSSDADVDLAAFGSIFNEVFEDGSWQPTAEEMGRFRAEVEAGGNRCHALATLDGSPVGTGFISSFDCVCEITRMATLPEVRRRGVAATVASFMMRDRFESGDTLVWLTASDAIAQALYEKLGFSLVGERLYYQAEGRVVTRLSQSS